MQDKIFYVSCFGFIFGILLRSFFFFNTYLIFFLIFLSFLVFLFLIFVSKNKMSIIASIFILFISIGILRFNISDLSYPSVFSSNLGNKLMLSGIVIDDPVLNENSQKLIVEIENKKEITRILVTTNKNNIFKYGDVLSFNGILEKPENFITDQGKEFDYVNYLRKDGIYFTMGFPNINIVSSGNGSWFREILFSIKNKFLEKIDTYIKEPESKLLGGLILGEKSSFSDSLRQSFINTGTIHIVALSGYNITIIAEWVMKIFSILPKNISIGLGIFSIFSFVLMTGLSSTAIRAGIMAVLVLFARFLGRNYDVSRALVIAGVIMILINPFVLVFDVSFQLSFIATIAVIFFTPKIEKYFLWVTKKFGLRDIISVTTSAYIFVLPFILYKMGNLSLVALPTNAIILPFIPLTMLFGFFTGIFGFISHFLAFPFTYVSKILLNYELSAIEYFSNIPFSSITIPNFPLILTLVIYSYFIYLLFSKSIKKFFDFSEI